MNFRSVMIATAALALSATLAFGQAKQPKPKSQKEVDALMAIQNAAGPDAQMQAVDSLLTKFADTEFKSWALGVATEAARAKNDYEKVMLYGERTVEADPKNFMAMLVMSQAIVSRTREHDLDKEEKLGRGEKLAKDAMELVKTAEKPNPAVPDEQWAAAKKDFEAQGHESLGMAAMVRKKWDVAAQEFRTSIATGATPEPATKVRLASVLNSGGKPDEAIKVIDELLADPQLNPQIRQFATQEKLKAAQAKGGAK